MCARCTNVRTYQLNAHQRCLISEFSNTFSLCVCCNPVLHFHVDVIIWNVHILIFTEWENICLHCFEIKWERTHSNTSLWIKPFHRERIVWERRIQSALCLLSKLGICCIHTFKYMNETKWASRMYLNHKSFLGVNASHSRVMSKFSTNEPRAATVCANWFLYPIHNGFLTYPYLLEKT